MPRKITKKIDPVQALLDLGAEWVPSVVVDEQSKPFDQQHTYLVDNETGKSVEAMTHVVVTCDACGQWRITKKGKKPKCSMTPRCKGKMFPPDDLVRRPSWASVMKQRAEME